MENQNPNDDDVVVSPEDFVQAERRGSMTRAITTLDDDPEKAARAQELSDATGVHPALVHGDLENFESQHKAQLTAGLFNENRFLREYVNSHPLAGSISNDDYGALDSVSQSLSKMRLPLMPLTVGGTASVLGKAAQAFNDEMNKGPLGTWVDQAPGSENLWRSSAFLYKLLGAPIEIPSRLITGVIAGGHAAVVEGGQQLGMNETQATKLANDLAGMVEHEMIRSGGARPIELGPEHVEAFQKAMPWISKGEEPPVGVHPEIDKLKIEQSKTDLANLDESMKEAQGSKTKERSPDLFAGFVRQHTDAKIGISADAIAKLYGDKQPLPDDGILGWHDGVAEQLQSALATGGDVEIPLADWLAKVDPEVAKELHDDIRVRPGGITKNEADLVHEMGGEPKEEPEAAEPIDPNLQPLQTVREAAGLEEPKFSGTLKLPEGTKPGEEVELNGYKTKAVGETTLGSVIDDLDYKSLGEPSKTIYDNLLNRIQEKLGDTPVRIVPITEVRKLLDSQKREVGASGTAYYNPNKHEIVLADQFFDKVTNRRIVARTVLHEAAHALTSRAIYEHADIERSIRSIMGEAGDVLDAEQKQKFNYAFSNPHEFVAEAFSNPEFQSILSATLASDALIARLKLGQGKRTVWEAFKNIVKDVLEKMIGYRPEDTLLDGVLQVAKKIEGREIRKGRIDPDVKQSPKEPELPGMTRMEDREPFTGSIPDWMSAKDRDRYMELIEKRQVEDREWLEKKIVDDGKKQLSKEWKDAKPEVEAKVRQDTEVRPDIAADQLLGEGVLFGDKVGKQKLGAEFLTDEQKAGLPKDYIAKDGLNPDDLAGLFGYPTGDALVDRLSALTKERETAGMTPKAYRERVIDIETQRQMQAKFGEGEAQILEDAKEQALSETQVDLLHEQTLALATKIDAEFSLTKGQIKTMAMKRIADTKLEAISSDRFLADAGRASRQMEHAFLSGDEAEAFRQSQRRYLAVLFAKEAKKIEKLKDQFDRRAKQLGARDLPSIKTEYVNYLHDTLMRLGQPVRRSIQDLQDAIGKENHESFSAFVDTKEAELRDLHVPEFLRDPDFRKPVDQLTVDEFKQANDAIKAMAFNGRDELKLDRAGEKEDLAAVLGQMKEQIRSLGEAKSYPVDRKPSKVINTGKSWWWSGITVESMLNRLDRDNPRGLFNQYIVYPFTEASNYKDRLIKEYQSKIAEVGKIPDMDKLVQNDLFIDPITQQPLIFRRRNVLGILQNIGNRSNLEKLAGGYEIEPAKVMEWVLRNTTKEDWDRAQKIGDLFKEIFDKADVMSHNVSGVGVQRLDLEPIQTPHGEYPGWYNPIKYDPLRPGKSKKLLGQSVEEEGFYRATTPQGYTKQRTGYIAPIELNLDTVPTRMKQMLHDIAMRPAVLQLSKVFYDPSFKKEMIAHFGQHQAESMIPFLKDIANSANFKSLEQATADQALEFFRQNTIATLIGFNPGTVMKHGTTALVNSVTEVGGVAFLRELKTLVGQLPGDRDAWNLAMGKSEELQRRMRNFQELMSGHGAEINIRGAQSNFGSLREFLMSAGATPVSISDLLSAVPTWLAKYKSEIAEGADEGSAVAVANRAVRRAHGSSVLSNKPAIMRSTSNIGAWFSSLYGFFSHMQQKQYELAWKARDMLSDTLGKGSGDPESGARHAPDLVKGLFSYVIVPALIEELVTPYSNSEKESWGVKAGKTLALGVSSSFIGVRDFVRGLVNVRDPSAGLIGTSLKTATDLGRDLNKGPQAFTKEKAGNLIAHSASLAGVLSGLTNAQEGRMIEYLYRYSKGMEKPKGPWDMAVGLRYGKSDKHSHSFEEWRRQTFGGH